jgi:uncharacterized protein YukE
MQITPPRISGAQFGGSGTMYSTTRDNYNDRLAHEQMQKSAMAHAQKTGSSGINVGSVFASVGMDASKYGYGGAVSQMPGGVLGGAGSIGNFDPWGQYRPAAADQLAQKMSGPSPTDFYMNKLMEMSSGQFNSNDPSYQWRFDQGQQAVERSLASKGLLHSGNAAIELQQYGQGAASQEYGAQFNRMLQAMSGVESAYDSQMQRLMKMAGVDLDPTAGTKMAIAAGSLGVDQFNAQTNRMSALAGAQNQNQANQNSMASQVIANWFK